MERLAVSTGWKNTRNPVDDVAYTDASQVESCLIGHSTNRARPAGSQVPPRKTATGGQDTVQQLKGNVPGVGRGQSRRNHRLPCLRPRRVTVEIDLPVPDGGRRAV